MEGWKDGQPQGLPLRCKGGGGVSVSQLFELGCMMQ